MIKSLEDGSIILEAKVLKVYPTEVKGWWFEVTKVKVEFPSKNPEFPNQILLEQTGNKASLAKSLQEWESYRFSIDFLARDWNDTCFWRVQARKVEPLNEWDDNDWNVPF